MRKEKLTPRKLQIIARNVNQISSLRLSGSTKNTWAIKDFTILDYEKEQTERFERLVTLTYYNNFVYPLYNGKIWATKVIFNTDGYTTESVEIQQ